jgi:segregation and condensation protein A
MSYEVKTRVFEGPLDLLLQLITSHQLEITELSLVDIVTEYLAHLEAMRETDIDVTSEFLLIAATLIQLKARDLLPDDRAIDVDEELALAEERDRLLSRLLACLTFKDVAAVIDHRLESGLRYVPRLAGLDADLIPPPPLLRLEIGPAGLALVAERALAPRQTEPDVDHLDFDLPSVDEAIADLHARIAREVEAEFDGLVAHCERPIQVVAYFLALLELARWGALRLSQEHGDAPIVVRHRTDGVNSEVARLSHVSEWGRTS